MEGVPTTAGCRAVADEASPAAADAACLAGARSAGARIVGRTNLHELALGRDGCEPVVRDAGEPPRPAPGPGGLVERLGGGRGHRRGRRRLRQRHRWVGTDPRRVLWHGRAQDHVGADPAPRGVAVVTQFRHGGPHGPRTWPASCSAWSSSNRVSWWRTAPRSGWGGCGWRPHPSIDEAIDRALDAAEVGGRRDRAAPMARRPRPRPGSCSWPRRGTPTATWWRDAPGDIGADVVGRLRIGESIDARGLASARTVKDEWDACLDEVFRRVDVIATPTLTVFPPPLEGGEELLMARCTLPVNLAGVPALALPVPTAGCVAGEPPAHRPGPQRGDAPGDRPHGRGGGVHAVAGGERRRPVGGAVTVVEAQYSPATVSVCLPGHQPTSAESA